MSLLASHARHKGEPDAITLYSAMAKKRAEEVGQANIIDGTIGSFLEDDGSLKVLKTIETALQEVTLSDSAGYAPIAGLPEFIDALLESVFRDHRPEAYISALATPGGTGALRNASYNYLETGETCLTTDYCWANYRNLLAENGRLMETFTTFDEEDHFNIPACLEKCHEIAARQRNVMLLLNTPAHNPTGFELSYSEWEKMVAELSAIANNGKNNIILVVDVAYIDFAGPDARDFFSLFNDLPENFLVIVCTSMSKGYTLYGYRLGAMIAVSSSAEVCEEFKKANSASARATWSNSSRPAMMAITNIFNDPVKLAAFRKEEQALSDSLMRRADIFLKEAAEVQLKLCPYKSGFFLLIPTPTEALAIRTIEILQEKDIFFIPFGKGVRVAISAISEQKIKGLAKACKEALDQALAEEK